MNAAERPPLGSLPGLAAALARQWWPQVAALAAACGVVATTISGALCVGDGMQTGLARLAVERLGRIDAAVIAEEFFTATLATNLTAGSGAPRHAVPAIVMPAIAVKPGGVTARVTLLACDDPAALGFEPATPALVPEGVLVNQPLAAALGLAAGDPVVLRLPTPSNVPADSPLGRRTGESAGRRMLVTAVLPPRGIGQFSLRPTQATAPLVVTSLDAARRILRLDDAANVLFAVGMPAGSEALASLGRRYAARRSTSACCTACGTAAASGARARDSGAAHKASPPIISPASRAPPGQTRPRTRASSGLPKPPPKRKPTGCEKIGCSCCFIQEKTPLFFRDWQQNYIYRRCLCLYPRRFWALRRFFGQYHVLVCRNLGRRRHCQRHGGYA
jgi:hypothetical protein